MVGVTLRRCCALLLLASLAAGGLLAQNKPKPGFNMFSKEQDVEIGKQGSEEIEKQVKLVTDKRVNDYVQRIGQCLASQPEADNYPYSFKVVWDESINAFALPGGPTYVHTGLILAADNEAQLAGVMGHEIAHVALRHGTNQASKANLFQLGAILGGSMAGSGIGGQLAQLGIGFGANSVLLKFSRGAEKQADILGAYMMSGCGYNPLEAARFFEKLQAETGDRGKLEQFFSSHPNPGNRTERIEEEIPHMPQREYTADSGQLERIKAILRGSQPPPEPDSQPKAGTAAPSVEQPGAPAPVSSQQQNYQGRAFALAYPRNWKVLGDDGQGSVTFAPEDGLVQSQGGNAIARGIVVSMRPANRGQRTDLSRDTQSLIQQLKQSNPSMQQSRRGARRVQIDGSEGLITTLYSESPFAGQTEIDMLVTVARPNGLYYMVFIAPRQEFRQYQKTFESILTSIRFSN